MRFPGEDCLVGRLDQVRAQPKRLLSAPTVGDVDGYPQHVARRPASVTNQRDGAVHPHRRPVGAHVTLLDGVDLAALQQARQQLCVMRAVVGVGDIQVFELQQLVARATDQLTEAVVHQQETAREVPLGDADRSLVEARRETLTLLGQRGRELLAALPRAHLFSYVDSVNQNAVYLALRVAGRLADDVDEHLLECAVATRVQLDQRFVGNERLTGLIHAVE